MEGSAGGMSGGGRSVGGTSGFLLVFGVIVVNVDWSWSRRRFLLGLFGGELEFILEKDVLTQQGFN